MSRLPNLKATSVPLSTVIDLDAPHLASIFCCRKATVSSMNACSALAGDSYPCAVDGPSTGTSK
jgi:hypothetical protein